MLAYRFGVAFLFAGLLLRCTPGPAQTIPWVLPWNDATKSLTDFSALNTSITTNRVGVDTNGHFVVNGSRVRFLGVNFAGDSPFTPTNYTEGVAARLAKCGINCIRFHHMDASWAYNGGLLSYTSTSSTNFNATNLERLHFMVSRLKARGIYSDINLLVGRQYRFGDGLGTEVTNGMDWKTAHALGFFYAPALALQKDYARKLLTPTNRFTGLSLAQDPAVAFVEILNENGIIQQWYDGNLDTLAARYSTNLQARWNNWLYTRYTNDAAMLAAWRVVDQPLGTNLLANGNFSNNLAGWNLEQHGVAGAAFTRTYDFTNSQPCIRVTVTNTDTLDWYIQINYPNLALDSNQVYTVSYQAKSSPATNVSASIMQAHASWAGLGYNRSLSLTTNWQQFANTFQPSASDTNARVGFGSMGTKLATFWYADVRLQRGGQLGTLPSGASLAAQTVPNLSYSATGYQGTREARRDWLQFLRELEYAYYDEMAAYLRTNIGYPGLIFGTIMANSPATVQSRLDVIDGHAYWQHPQFPGTAWDSVNWYQSNISMVNTLGDDNTLAGLARQRIKGKPFTVTEYQHPSPNYYGGEGPLMLAAYAALQDWDGLWLFDYGYGTPAAATGYVRSYFEIGQHPTKLVNLALAANLFRRGDARPATREYTMALTPETELDTLLSSSAWSLFSSSKLGMSGKWAFNSRINTAVGTNAAGLTTAPVAPTGSVMTSDTGELCWDLTQPTNGLLTINTARTKGLIGYADNRAVSLGGLTFQPGATRLGWCTLAATLLRGEAFTNDCTALVAATGWWENTGQVWTDSTKTSVANNWGQAPVLAEVVPFSLTLPVGTNCVRVWALDETGQRKLELPVTGTSVSTTFTATTNSGTVWYELQVARWTASFDLWRLRYFTESELTNSAVSGAAAAPDGDRMANLWKYYLGLPGKSPAAATNYPVGGLFQPAGRSYLSFTYLCDPLATDVACTPEVSTNLHSWLAGSAYTAESRSPAGELEQVTVWDLLPMGAGARHFLRLKLDWP